MNIRELAANFEANQSEIMNAFENEKRAAVSDYEAKKAECERKYRRAVNIANKEVANEFEQINISLTEVLDKLVPDKKTSDEAILEVAEYLTLGEMVFSGEKFNIHHSISVPLLIEFLGHSNILITSREEENYTVTREIVFRTLLQTAPGQLEIIVYDPYMTSVMSPFSKLGGEEASLKIIHHDEELLDELNEAISSIGEIQSQMQGAFENIVDFRRVIKQPAGKYRIFVIIGLPVEISQKSYDQLTYMLKNAPKSGTSFIINYEEDKQLPEFVKIDVLKRNCSCLKIMGDSILLENKNYKCPFITRSAAEIAKSVSEHAIKAEKMKSVTISFESIVPNNTEWKKSSADGIEFPIGKRGLSDEFISLGNDVKQLHNIIITGAVGQGKSNLIKVIIHSICSQYSPNEVIMYLLDFKEGVTLAPFSNIGKADYLPHAKVLGLESDKRFGLEVLRHINTIMRERNGIFSKNSCDNISNYRKRNPDVIMPRIVLIIDEFYFLFNIADKIGEEAAALLESIARKGRSAGIHIILASQTISGAEALRNKQDGIFGQFRTRIALKNTLSESYATLSPGNDAAARLKIRGQAIVNNEGGIIGVEYNKAITVAWASDEYFEKIRKNWWNKTKQSTEPPFYFIGTAYRYIAEVLPSIMKNQSASAKTTDSIKAVCGMKIKIGNEPEFFDFSDTAGRNVAIFGSGENDLFSEEDAPTDNAVGVLQSIALSLALQHRKKEAKFIMFNLMDKTTYAKNNMDLWLEAMKCTGHEVEILDSDAIPEFIINTVDSLNSGTTNGIPTYILGFSMDREKNLFIQEPITLQTPGEIFTDILSSGPQRGIHFIGSWKSVQSYSKLMSFNGSGCIEVRIILHLDKELTKSLSDPLIEWNSDDNRALFLDQSSGGNVKVIIPFAPLRKEDVDIIKRTVTEG